jgi:hypothetical protein
MPVKPPKTATILKLLGRPNGATIEHLQKVTSWQPHSIRAAITGLRKKGHEIRCEKNAKGLTTYCLAKAT